MKDTGDTYVYVKDNNYIGRYNQALHQYENIWAGGSSKYFTDVDVSPNGKVWAVTSNSSSEVVSYDGNNWIFYPSTISYGFQGIKMVNDTLACLYDLYKTFHFFHNGIFDSVYTYQSYYLKDWDVDVYSNIWIAATTELIHIVNGTVMVYDATNSPIGTDQFLHVKIGTNGHVWMAGKTQKVYEFDGTNWHTYSLPSYNTVDNFILNKHNLPWVISTAYQVPQLLKFNNNTWSMQNFPFMPLTNLRAMGMTNNGVGYKFANKDGLFEVYYNPIQLLNFKDSANYPYSNEINCFIEDSPTSEYCSNHGIIGLYGFNNALLPNDTINSACYENGTYYIGTNNGLLTYNGILYNTFNMENTPLPSNKITFVATSKHYQYDYNNALYIGTDKGLVMYKDGLWRVFDSTTIPVNSFYVTGAIYGWNNDSSILISTLGSGLINAYLNGGYDIYNTAHGNFLDDSLYYLQYVERGECFSFWAAGTAKHGIVTMDNFQPNIFIYDTLDWGLSKIHSSRLLANSNNGWPTLISTDSLVYLAYPCGAVAEHQPNQQLKWYQSEGNLIITVPNDLLGKGSLLLSDMSGRTLIERDCSTESGKISLDISNFATGIYLFRLIRGNKVAYAKVSLIRE